MAPQPTPNPRPLKRDGQAYELTPSDILDPRTTHIAKHKEHGFLYFCRFDGETYWITPSPAYGTCYRGASLWKDGFDFEPLDHWMTNWIQAEQAQRARRAKATESPPVTDRDDLRHALRILRRIVAAQDHRTSIESLYFKQARKLVKRRADLLEEGD